MTPLFLWDLSRPYNHDEFWNPRTHRVVTLGKSQEQLKYLGTQNEINQKKLELEMIPRYTIQKSIIKNFRRFSPTEWPHTRPNHPHLPRPLLDSVIRRLTSTTHSRLLRCQYSDDLLMSVICNYIENIHLSLNRRIQFTVRVIELW